MHYLVVSFTHKNTNISTREKLAFGNDLEKETFLSKVVDCNYINEAILTSTCNRVEIVASVSNIKNATKSILEALDEKSHIGIEELENIVDTYEDESAVHHLFTVVSSLDSLVVGETQIAGQFKDAFKFSRDKIFISTKLTRLVNYAFKCAKNVRNATSLGTGSVSVASTAVAQAKEIFVNPKEVKALVIGAGEMSELTIRTFLRDGFTVVLTSRNIKKAQLLATTIIASNTSYHSDMIEIEPYEKLSVLLNEMRLLVTATSAPYPIITEDLVEEVDFQRYWFDIAIPRDIETMELKSVKVFAVDDLKDIVQKNLDSRSEQAKHAYSIIGSMTKEFYIWLGSLGVEPILKKIYLNSNEIINKKIQNAISKKFIRDEDKENIIKLCQTVMSEFLHTTTSNLREASKDSESDRLINTVQTLYGLENLEDLEEKEKCEQALRKN
ncbi:MAG: glutamyl-tRNA reductase [Arcobacteraceae bacterium]|nr:glutamyl-tRNA reductase [Arcobacteraceae bacterium]